MSKVEYHCVGSCNKCKGSNSVEITDTLDGHTVLEAKTACSDCGFEDYWAYGWFESGQDMISKCEKYSY